MAFLHDLRYGVRMLLKHPGLAVISILAFGLGLGLTATMWSINYGAMLRGLPFEDGRRIMNVGRAIPERDIDRTGILIPDLAALRERQTSFADLAGWSTGTINVSGPEGRPERYRGGFLTPNAFAITGVRPLLGRFFDEEESRFGGPAAVILGYDLWRNRFHGDSTIVGRAIRVNAVPTTVVGVMPEGFKFPVDEALWVPIRPNPAANRRDAGTVNAFGRLQPGVTTDRAMQEFTRLEANLTREFPETNRGVRPLIEPYGRPFIDEAIPMLWTMMGAVIAVLLIACSNVANLLLARAAVRTKEVAVRTALGASRWRIVSQLLAEALVLAGAGAVLGLVIAALGTTWFVGSIQETGVPFFIRITVDTPIVLFLLGVTVLCAIVSGVMPALQATGTRIYDVLKDESRGASSMRLGKFSKSLVVVEIALSCGLLIGAGFMIESVVRRSTFDYGVPTASVFTARVGLFEASHPDSAARQRFWSTLEARLAAQPGHAGVALVTGLPGLGVGTTPFAVEGRTYATEREYPRARTTAVTPGFFTTFRLAPSQGRVFGDGDIGTTQPVVVVTQNFAARHFPGTSPLGQRVRLGGEGSTRPFATIVGVIPDVWLQGTDDEIPEGILTPLRQGDYRFVSVAVASAGPDPMTFADVVRREVAGVDPDQPIYFERTLQKAIDDNGWFYSVFGKMFMVFGFAALLLATVGVYGVMSFAVTRRTQEVGVRMALGAGRGHVLAMFLRQGVLQVGIGVTIGLGLAVLLAQGLKLVLFQVDTNNPLMFAGVMTALAVTGLVAVLIPARRATRVDPVVALKYD